MFPFNAYTAKDPDPIKIWQHLHGASSHFPIALLFVACAFDFGSMIFRKPAWRVVSFWMLIGAAVVAIPATITGLTGLNGWFGGEAWPAEHTVLHRNTALIMGGTTLLLAIWRVVRRDRMVEGTPVSPMRGSEWIAYLCVLLAATLLGGYTGLLGAYVARGY